MSGLPNIEKRLGWKRDSLDARDHCFSARHASIASLPPKVDLRSLCPPVRDQKDLGCCTGFGVAFACHFDFLKQNPKRAFEPSPLFIYYNERTIENTVKQDAGAQIRDGFKAIADFGVCSEKAWKYEPAKFAKRPPKSAFKQALKHRAVQYSRIGQTIPELQAALADGYPVVFGMSVFSSFESQSVAETGVVPMPVLTEALLGGHCTALVGYDSAENVFFDRNSWSDGWGDKGYCYLPFNYIANPNLASDFWTVRILT